MMSHEVAKLMNEQINKEFYSAYLYLDMANFYGERDLDGFANYFRIQAMEERDHAMKFLDYLAENNEAISLEAIAKPEADRSSLMAPLVQALKHEEFCHRLDPQHLLRRHRGRRLPQPAVPRLVHR